MKEGTELLVGSNTGANCIPYNQELKSQVHKHPQRPLEQVFT